MTFDEFWEHYPKKVAKLDAIKAWGQLTMFDLVEIEGVYELHCRSWRGKDPDWLPHPATWLRGRRWEDAVTRPKALGPSYSAFLDWQDECQREHGGICPNAHFHAAKMEG